MNKIKLWLSALCFVAAFTMAFTTQAVKTSADTEDYYWNDEVTRDVCLDTDLCEGGSFVCKKAISGVGLRTIYDDPECIVVDTQRNP